MSDETPRHACSEEHGDDSPFRDRRACQVVHDRLLKVEFQQANIEARMHEGAAMFESLRREDEILKERSTPKPKSFLAVMPWLISLLALTGGLLWQAARYPDRNEFERVKAQMATTESFLTEKLSVFKVEQAKITAAVDKALDSVQRVEQQQGNIGAKLDRLLERK